MIILSMLEQVLNVFETTSWGYLDRWSFRVCSIARSRQPLTASHDGVSKQAAAQVFFRRKPRSFAIGSLELCLQAWQLWARSSQIRGLGKSIQTCIENHRNIYLYVCVCEYYVYRYKEVSKECETYFRSKEVNLIYFGSIGYIYIYKYMCVCMCVCRNDIWRKFPESSPRNVFLSCHLQLPTCESQPSP